jgi:hypothetical protein
MLSVPFGIGAGTTFIKIDALLKAREIVQRNYRIGPVVGNQVSKIPA